MSGWLSFIPSFAVRASVCGLLLALAAPARGAEPAIDFRNDIEPILSRHGCNAGGCHGKASGQNGFKLSLFGFDAAFDYDEIVKRARGRRISVSAPEQSLLLVKATGKVPHGGGRRLEPESEAYKTLHNWIAGGTPGSSPDAPKIVSLAIEPKLLVMQRGQSQPLKVAAVMSNGKTRDVTAETSFSSNLDVVASVSEAGVVQAGQQSGEAAIMARYQGQVTVFSAIIPHGQPLTEIP
ncbi:MAG: S-layer protein, partial [Planctomycetales bacterium]|nr:S-layer protein [Planctomycetales bacterium]